MSNICGKLNSLFLLKEDTAGNKYLPVAQRFEKFKIGGLVGAGLGVGITGILIGCGAPLSALITLLALAAISASVAAMGHYYLANDIDLRLALFVDRLNNNIGIEGPGAWKLNCSSGVDTLRSFLKHSQNCVLEDSEVNQCDWIMEIVNPILVKLERGMNLELEEGSDAFKQFYYMEDFLQ